MDYKKTIPLQRYTSRPSVACNTQLAIKESVMHLGYAVDTIYLFMQAVYFRKFINDLSILVEQSFELNPFDNALFVFMNRQRNKMKILYWHRNGFCLWLKRLEQDKFAWVRRAGQELQSITMEQLSWLIDEVDIWQHRPHKSLTDSTVS